MASVLHTLTLEANVLIVMSKQSSPVTPAAGMVSIYPKADGHLYIKDDVGIETDLTATGSGGSGISLGMLLAQSRGLVIA